MLLLVPTGMVSASTAPSTTATTACSAGSGWPVAVTTIGLLITTRLALKERSYSAVMAATGLLYLAIITAFGTDLVARALLSARVPWGRKSGVPRAIWSGSVSFGLVNIPVKLYSAVSRKTVHFNQLDSRTGARVKQKRRRLRDRRRGPVGPDRQGLRAVVGRLRHRHRRRAGRPRPRRRCAPSRSRSSSTSSAIDPIFYDSAYYLAPDKASKPYALLARAMEEQGKVGIAHFVLRTKQYLAAIRPSDGRLLLSTMVYADELNDPASIDELDEVVDVEISDKELAMASQLVESLAADFEPERFKDTYRQSVLELIEKKAAGEEIVAPVSQIQPDKVVDLMAALEASVAAAKEARTRHPTAHDADEDAGDEPAAAPKAVKKARKAPAKKAAAKKATARRKSA